MAAGFITLPVKDSAGGIRLAKFWSSDGSVTGVLEPVQHLDDDQLATLATAANQATANASLASILAKISADPATQTTLAAILAKTSADQATSAKQDALSTLIGPVSSSPTANTVLARLKAIGDALAGSLTVATHAVTQSGSWVLSAGSALIGKVAPSDDQDPIFDTANGKKVTLVATTNTELIVAPAGCKFLRVEADYDTFIAFGGGTADNTATCIKIAGAMPAETIPVTPGETINAYSASAATVRAMPYKVR